MTLEARYILGATLVGLGATLLIDLWALLLRVAFKITSLNYCFLGRWLLHMPGGIMMHRSIAAAQQKPHECALGWVAHYAIGATFAILFVLLAPGDWLERPTLLPALAFDNHARALPYNATIVRARRGRFEDTEAEPGETEEPDDSYGIWSWALHLGLSAEPHPVSWTMTGKVAADICIDGSFSRCS